MSAEVLATNFHAAAPTQPASSTILGGISRRGELDSSMVRAFEEWSPREVSTMSQQSLRSLKETLGHGKDLLVWETGREFFPNASDSNLRIDLPALIVHYLPPEQKKLFHSEGGHKRKRGAKGFDVLPIDGAREAEPAHQLLFSAAQQGIRWLTLLRFGPAGIGKKGAGRPLDRSSIIGVAIRPLPRMLAASLSKRLTRQDRTSEANDARHFCYLSAEDFAAFSGTFPSLARTEAKRLQVLADGGYWFDVVPGTKTSRTSTTHVSGPEIPRLKPTVVDPHKPLNDDYVSELGRHSLWIVRNLAPALMAVASEVEALWRATERPNASDSAIAQQRDGELEVLLSGTDALWVDSAGRPITCLPFTEGGMGEPPPRWPVRNYRGLVYILKLVQMAHFFVIALPMAGRHSEVTTLGRDCQIPAKDGEQYVQGRTWKLVDRHDGALREWVLPALSMQAIEQQVQLVAICERIARRNTRPSKVKSGGHLFAQIGISSADGSKRLSKANGPLQWYARALGLPEKPDDQNLRVHRLRKTIGRLGGLAIAESPRVLMDVFGHESMEATLYYILTDKEIQGEAETAAREIRVVKATELVEDIVRAEESADASGPGGPAAANVSAAIHAERESLHQRGEDWGADSARRLAEVLTLRGKAWLLVRPGVMCTKNHGTESGPCNKSRGRPEPARCQSYCSHRLEAGYLRADVEGCIADSVREYESAKVAANELTMAFWAGQLSVHLPRFDDIRKRWKANITVQEMLKLCHAVGGSLT